MTLPEQLLELHSSLSARRIPHAFGGAIALAYWTLDPRGTSDIDLNVFVAAQRSRRVLSALPASVQIPPTAEPTIAAEGQIRLWWDQTPIDLFFDYAPIHGDAARHRKQVEFAGQRIPILGPVELAVFKVMFDRTRDWADIEAMLEAETLDANAVRKALLRMLDAGDPRLARLRGTLARSSRPRPA